MARGGWESRILTGPEPRITHGYWWINYHQLCETVYVQCQGLQSNGCESINKLTSHGFLFGGVYHMKRIRLSDVDRY
jgi:hypothetical protein